MSAYFLCRRGVQSRLRAAGLALRSLSSSRRLRDLLREYRDRVHPDERHQNHEGEQNDEPGFHLSYSPKAVLSTSADRTSLEMRCQGIPLFFAPSQTLACDLYFARPIRPCAIMGSL
jgi:hypothetical protein